jgi:hypothetical protein
MPPMRSSSIFAMRASSAARGKAAPKSDMKLDSGSRIEEVSSHDTGRGHDNSVS